jgi:hypothetical protein
MSPKERANKLIQREGRSSISPDAFEEMVRLGAFALALLLPCARTGVSARSPGRVPAGNDENEKDIEIVGQVAAQARKPVTGEIKRLRLMGIGGAYADA